MVMSCRLRKEKHLEKAAGFFLRAMKEALPDDAARYYKCPEPSCFHPYDL